MENHVKRSTVLKHLSSLLNVCPHPMAALDNMRYDHSAEVRLS